MSRPRVIVRSGRAPLPCHGSPSAQGSHVGLRRGLGCSSSPGSVAPIGSPGRFAPPRIPVREFRSIRGFLCCLVGAAMGDGGSEPTPNLTLNQQHPSVRSPRPANAPVRRVPSQRSKSSLRGLKRFLRPLMTIRTRAAQWLRCGGLIEGFRWGDDGPWPTLSFPA